VEKKKKKKKKRKKKPYKWSERFLKFVFLPFLIFIIIGLLQVCLFKMGWPDCPPETAKKAANVVGCILEKDVVPNTFGWDEENLKKYRPFKWSQTGTTWYGQWFGLMQINSWSWLNAIYSKYFDSLKTTFKAVEVEEGDNITSKIMKGFGKFWVILGMGFIYSIIWIVQAIFGWLLPGSQAFIYLFSSSENQKEVSNIDRFIGYIGFFVTVIPLIFNTWILQLLYFPFLLWNNRKEKGIFNPLGSVYRQEQNGGIFTSIISSFLLMFSISFLLLGNNIGYAIGGSSLLLLGFFSLFSCYHFYNMISKDTDSPVDKKTPEVPIKKKERKNGTNFPTEEPVKAATGAAATGTATKFENPEDMEIENPEDMEIENPEDMEIENPEAAVEPAPEAAVEPAPEAAAPEVEPAVEPAAPAAPTVEPTVEPAASTVEPAVESVRYVSPLGESIEKESSAGWLKEHSI